MTDSKSKGRELHASQVKHGSIVLDPTNQCKYSKWTFRRSIVNTKNFILNRVEGQY